MILNRDFTLNITLSEFNVCKTIFSSSGCNFSNMSSVKSIPMTFPTSNTCLEAKNASIPAPNPQSTTISPTFKLAKFSGIHNRLRVWMIEVSIPSPSCDIPQSTMLAVENRPCCSIHYRACNNFPCFRLRQFLHIFVLFFPLFPS